MATAPGKFPESPVTDTMAKKSEVLYTVLGLIIPGLPSLLIRDNKKVGAIQLVILILSWIIFMIAPLVIGFLPWIAVAIWSGITGYGDARRWNRSHTFSSDL